MEARLYAVPASHPSFAGARMLEHKGIACKRRDLLPVISRAIVRCARVPRRNRAGGEGRRAQGAGSREISRELDRLPRSASLPLGPGEARRGRRGRALRRRGASAPGAADPLVGDQARQEAAARLLGGSQAGHPDRPGGAAPRRRSSRSRSGSTTPATRTFAAASPPFRDSSTGSTPGSRRDSRRRAAQCRRLPDRQQPGLGDDPRRPSPRDRGPPRRRARPAGRAELPGQGSTDPSARLAAAAALADRGLDSGARHRCQSELSFWTR